MNDGSILEPEWRQRAQRHSAKASIRRMGFDLPFWVLCFINAIVVELISSTDSEVTNNEIDGPSAGINGVYCTLLHAISGSKNNDAYSRSLLKKL
jgi:hypothetical protein